jgi:hypothetical protein
MSCCSKRCSYQRSGDFWINITAALYGHATRNTDVNCIGMFTSCSNSCVLVLCSAIQSWFWHTERELYGCVHVLNQHHSSISGWLLFEYTNVHLWKLSNTIFSWQSSFYNISPILFLLSEFQSLWHIGTNTVLKISSGTGKYLLVLENVTGSQRFLSGTNFRIRYWKLWRAFLQSTLPSI